MRLSLPKYYNRRIVRAIAEFNMIQEGDNIVIGFSGGKDSAFLLYALKALEESMAIDFKVSALTIDLEFSKEADFSAMEEYCERLNIPYHIRKSNIAQIILDEGTKNPCADCAYFRKGVISKYMKEKGFNKVAYGHHLDDVVETFLMSIIYSGQVKTFQPKSYLSDNNIDVIRPLIYLREESIIQAKKLTGYQEIKSPCPYDGKTKREEIKNLIKDLDHDNQIFYNIASAMREGAPTGLWPTELSKDDIKDRAEKLWY